jgi:hypothetical protein
MQVDSQHAPTVPKRTTVTIESDSDSEGYTQVKRRRATSAGAVALRGRPRNIDRPEKGNQNIMTILTPTIASQL